MEEYTNNDRTHLAVDQLVTVDHSLLPAVFSKLDN